jgi:hypothetical protein
MNQPIQETKVDDVVHRLRCLCGSAMVLYGGRADKRWVRATSLRVHSLRRRHNGLVPEMRGVNTHLTWRAIIEVLGSGLGTHTCGLRLMRRGCFSRQSCEDKKAPHCAGQTTAIAVAVTSL